VWSVILLLRQFIISEYAHTIQSLVDIVLVFTFTLQLSLMKTPLQCLRSRGFTTNNIQLPVSSQRWLHGVVRIFKFREKYRASRPVIQDTTRIYGMAMPVYGYRMPRQSIPCFRFQPGSKLSVYLALQGKFPVGRFTFPSFNEEECDSLVVKSKAMVIVWCDW